jgi:hypothetical protein
MSSMDAVRCITKTRGGPEKNTRTAHESEKKKSC